MKKFRELILDLLFPIQCFGCGKFNVWLCQDCFGKIEINKVDKSYFLFENQVLLDGVWVAADYSQVLIQKILHSYKYNFVADLGEVVADLLIQFFSQVVSDELVFDLVIPVPLAKKRIIWRGFNQAEILAQKISQQFGWMFQAKVLIRRRYTRPQVGLKAAERKVNLQEAFKVTEPQLIRDKKILLVDDVITTGTTMSECARVLKQAGAKEVLGL